MNLIKAEAVLQGLYPLINNLNRLRDNENQQPGEQSDRQSIFSRLSQSSKMSRKVSSSCSRQRLKMMIAADKISIQHSFIAQARSLTMPKCGSRASSRCRMTCTTANSSVVVKFDISSDPQRKGMPCSVRPRHIRMRCENKKVDCCTSRRLSVTSSSAIVASLVTSSDGIRPHR
jgi:hypothetical protein